MQKAPKDRRLQLAGCFAVFILPLFLSSPASGQSGRRAPRTLPSSNALPNEKTEEAPVLTELARPTTVLVARKPTSKRFAAEDVIYSSFINRLNQYRGLTSKAIGDLKREQVVKRARGEAEALVVLLHFDIDNFQDGTILLNSQDLVVEYSVFAPRTGKQKSKGKVYYQGVGGGRLRKSEWPTGTPIKITPEAAGVEAAEQMYTWLAVLVGVKTRT